MKAKHIFLAIAASLVLPSFGSAREPITVVELIDHLDEALKECDWKSRNMTGAPKLKMLMHKRSMEDVLEGLKAGHVVDSAKLEEALRGHLL